MYPTFSLQCGARKIYIVNIEGDSHLTVECFDTDSCILLVDNTSSDSINRAFSIEGKQYMIRRYGKLEINLKPFIDGKKEESPDKTLMKKSIKVKYNHYGSVKINFHIKFKRRSRHSFEYHIVFDDGSVELIPRRGGGVNRSKEFVPVL